MCRSVVIDCFPESALRYGVGYGIVAIDVVRATTTAVTAAAMGYRCFPVPSIEAAFSVSNRLPGALLVGEQAGVMPPGFDLINSPAAIAKRSDIERPIVLLSSSGTRLCHAASAADGVLLASLRNFQSVPSHAAARFQHVAVIGAGTRGEFREEDQMCCAWVAEGLVRMGYEAEGRTLELIRRWSGASNAAWTSGRSAAYLRNTGQSEDLEYILDHVGDLSQPFLLRNGEVLSDAEAADLLTPDLDSGLVYA